MGVCRLSELPPEPFTSGSYEGWSVWRNLLQVAFLPLYFTSTMRGHGLICATGKSRARLQERSTRTSTSSFLQVSCTISLCVCSVVFDTEVASGGLADWFKGLPAKVLRADCLWDGKAMSGTDVADVDARR